MFPARSPEGSRDRRREISPAPSGKKLKEATHLLLEGEMVIFVNMLACGH